MYRRIVLLAVILLLAGCDIAYIAEQPAQNEVVYENNLEPGVYFCPADDCMGVLLNLTARSDTIHCAFYDLELLPLISSLAAKNAKLVMDNENYYDNKALFANISEIKTDSSGLMHNKFCIFDSKIVATGSFNPTERGAYFNNNNLVVIYSDYIAENYENEFLEMRHGIFKKGSKVKHPVVVLNNKRLENYFCPEDCDYSIYTDLISNAQSSVYFMTFSFTKDEIGNALINAYKNGIVVRGVFEKTQNNQWLEYPRLREAGIDVIWDNNKANMHHKVFIIDEKIVITGSTNPSNNGLSRNDENIIIFHDEDIAKAFLREFEDVWGDVK